MVLGHDGVGAQHSFMAHPPPQPVTHLYLLHQAHPATSTPPAAAAGLPAHRPPALPGASQPLNGRGQGHTLQGEAQRVRAAGRWSNLPGCGQPDPLAHLDAQVRVHKEGMRALQPSLVTAFTNLLSRALCELSSTAVERG